MKLKLVRKWFTDKSTVGELYINDVFECYTLEDVVREEKIYGETAIPYGEYTIEMTYSPKFKRYMPLLVNVPNYEAVRIHVGNYPKDTQGCILVGKGKLRDMITFSKWAFNDLMKKIQCKRNLTIEVICAKNI